MSKNDGKDTKKKANNNGHTGQPEPLSGSHKVKNRNHTRQKNHSHHDM